VLFSVTRQIWSQVDLHTRNICCFYVVYFRNISEIILDFLYVRCVRSDKGGLHKTTWNCSQSERCEIGVTDSRVTKYSSLLGCYTIPFGNHFQTLRRIVFPSSSRRDRRRLTPEFGRGILIREYFSFAWRYQKRARPVFELCTSWV